LTFFEDEKTFREIDAALKLRTDTASSTSDNKKDTEKSKDKDKERDKDKDIKIKNASNSPMRGEACVADSKNDNDEKVKTESALGIVDYDSETEKNEEMIVNETEKEDDIIDENSPESVKLREKYMLYKTFWGLQSFMSSDNVKRFVDAPTAAATTSNTGTTFIRISNTFFEYLTLY
jgi:hypothetical protein